jgi:hypothetical protein
MPKRTYYEWRIEHRDEYGDLVDFHPIDKLADVEPRHAAPMAGAVAVELILNRTVIDFHTPDCDPAFYDVAEDDCLIVEGRDVAAPRRYKRELAKLSDSIADALGVA